MCEPSTILGRYKFFPTTINYHFFILLNNSGPPFVVVVFFFFFFFLWIKKQRVMRYVFQFEEGKKKDQKEKDEAQPESLGPFTAPLSQHFERAGLTCTVV